MERWVAEITFFSVKNFMSGAAAVAVVAVVVVFAVVVVADVVEWRKEEV